jgi:tetratricopeptide (TPR) repeat protein
MAQILKFPGQTSKCDYRRAKRRAKTADNPNQLDLFPRPAAQILSFAPELSCFEQALISDERGDARAAELYEKAIEHGDCVADAYCNLGIIESQKGNASRAFDFLTAALQQNPRHSEAHYNLGNLYLDLNDLRLAQVHFEMAAQLDPSFANAYFNLALVEALNSNLPAALSALTKYQDLVPQDEGRKADELLQNLRRTLAVTRITAESTPLNKAGP